MMTFLSFMMSFLVSISPVVPSALAPELTSFTCDGNLVETTIYNNENGAYSIVKAYEELDAGAFVVINLENSKLMLPRTFNVGETSFTDGKWWWSYEDHQHPTFQRLTALGEIQEFNCEAQPANIGLGMATPLSIKSVSN
ncbi:MULTISPECIES: hypothetical protein [unclassified Prochlorococcus]|nr:MULTISPECIES: hypothetical protein [unclassified Prochlorococcus]KGG28103.1 hypothetical protein EV12_0851 [Prochlorococcus sp. MIT 0701]KGG32819.1 hypothetical protein EV14_1961 [Prochlorococcus sp. MIT 0703]